MSIGSKKTVLFHDEDLYSINRRSSVASLDIHIVSEADYVKNRTKIGVELC